MNPKNKLHLVVVLLAFSVFAGLCFGLSACSASAQQVQARILDVTARVANTALDVWMREYKRALMETADTACGNATPCADQQAATEAVAIVQGQWNPVFLAWASLQTSHSAYSVQIEACRVTTPQCTLDIAAVSAEVLRHQSEFRCALRRVHANDPFPGPLQCDSTTNHDAGVSDQ